MVATSAPSEITNHPVVKRLANGLTIIAEQMSTAAVNLNIWLRVGSRVESDAINGMAHFLEHMIFKGTPQLQCGEFERLIEERGAITNAATSQDYTHYYITTAPKDFAKLAPLQVELLLNAKLHDSDFERERPVILEEIRRSEDNPRRRIFQHSMALNFEQLPYRRTVLGPTSVIENLSAEQMRDFHRRWYQPQNMTAVVVGDLPVEQLIATVEKSFEQSLANRHRESITEPLEGVPLNTPEAPFESIARADYTDATLQQARLVLSWRVPGLRQLPETYALDVAASILGQGRTARLIQDLRETRALVNSISTSNITYGEQGVFYISANLAVEQLETVEAAVLEHIKRLHEQPVSEAELSRVRTQVANRYVFGNETSSERASMYGYYHAMTGDIKNALNYPTAIKTVDAASIQSAVQRYLPVTAYGALRLHPEVH
ncbi:insulinase family protein [Leptolyngbya cf. ectocarpi LEGE 11479]|uniref:Insulinase family protein n=1 Tax=Leptolyngbya cf. ectocarpi LEGE 11479 TaxID=1828722 RepID=A0A928X1A4_LEPEC|nr:pitrilysin family protein [Leptolyngbya ectocarpi]MBE9065551.1 insulinase family protein [Leptolyngbya cf. ectocarpi LEGE 11479]